MKKKDILQALLSLSLIIFEIILFDNSKYTILKWIGIPPYPTSLIAAKWLVAGSCIILLVIFLIILNRKRESDEVAPAFFVYLIKGMQSKAHSWAAILSTLYILIHISWIANFLMDGDTKDIPKTLISFCFLLFNPVLFLLFLEDSEVPQINDYTGIKNLVSQLPVLKSATGTSDLLINSQYKSAKAKRIDFDMDELNATTNTNGSAYPLFDNIDPIRKMIRKMRGVSRVWFITTDRHNSEEKNLIALKDILEEYFIDSEQRKVEINFWPELKSNMPYIRDLDPNDLDKVDADVGLLLNSLNRNGISDNTIAFNITSGTSVFSSVFALKTIKHGRRAFHIHQTDNNRIIQLNLNVYSIKDHWEEIIDKL